MNNICFKAKIGQKEHIEQLQKSGLVYCNTLQYFTQLEDGQVRGDNHENAYWYETFRNYRLQVKLNDAPDAKFKDVLDINQGQIVTRNANPYGNLFCLYSVDMTNAGTMGHIQVDDRNSEFGSWVLILLNTNEFERRLYAELEKRGLKFNSSHIDYVDLKNHSGRKTLFQKDKKYSYQNEFRIFIDSQRQHALTLFLGDISDISEVCEFNAFKRLEYKHANVDR